MKKKNKTPEQRLEEILTLLQEINEKVEYLIRRPQKPCHFHNNHEFIG